MLVEINTKSGLEEAAEKIAAQEHRKNPEETTGNVEDYESAIRHLRGSGDQWSEGADDWYEARDDNCLTTILLIKGMRLLQMARSEQLTSVF